MSPPLVVLDVDDTLYLERDYVRSGFAAVSDYVKHAYAVEGVFELAWEAFLSGKRGQIFDSIVEADARLGGRKTVPELVRVYRDHQPDIALLPDAERFIERQAGAAHLAVVTDGPAESQRRKVAALGLARWVSEIVITSERGAGWAKPEVRSFEYLQGLFDVKPRECVYFGDNPTKDFAGAKLIGWQTVRVRRPGGLHFDAESQHDVDRVIDNFDDSHWGGLDVIMSTSSGADLPPTKPTRDNCHLRPAGRFTGEPRPQDEEPPRSTP